MPVSQAPTEGPTAKIGVEKPVGFLHSEQLTIFSDPYECSHALSPPRGSRVFGNTTIQANKLTTVNTHYQRGYLGCDIAASFIPKQNTTYRINMTANVN